jgi:hypothetical protein
MKMWASKELRNGFLKGGWRSEDNKSYNKMQVIKMSICKILKKNL